MQGHCLTEKNCPFSVDMLVKSLKHQIRRWIHRVNALQKKIVILIVNAYRICEAEKTCRAKCQGLTEKKPIILINHKT